MSSPLERLKALTSQISTLESGRKENLTRLQKLFETLHINEKVESIERLLSFNAMNLSGITLKAESMGVIQSGKYVQVIAIDSNSEGKGSKNISLGYFGRAEKIDEGLKKEVILFVLSWRLEKSYTTVARYSHMIETLQ